MPDPTSPGPPRFRWRSFVHAGRGIADLLRTQPNARVHLAATLAVLALGGWLGIDREDWGLLIPAIGLVWIAEALNTALEHLADAVHPARDERIRRSKDAAAAGVLIAAIAAAAIGWAVLGPPLLARIR